jgi:hypothetical protein
MKKLKFFNLNLLILITYLTEVLKASREYPHQECGLLTGTECTNTNRNTKKSTEKKRNEYKDIHRILQTTRQKPMWLSEYLSYEDDMIDKNTVRNIHINEQHNYPLRVGPGNLLNVKERRLFDLNLNFRKEVRTHVGNFNHFFRICYENRFPVILTTDAMLEPLIFNINNITDEYENWYISSILRYFTDKVLKLIAELKLTYHCKSLDTDEGKKLCSMRKKLNAVEVMLVTGANLMNKDCGKRENEFTTKDMVRDYIIIIDKMRNENNGFYAFLGKSKYYNFSKL